MAFTIFGFIVLAIIWTRGRMRDAVNGVRAYEDPDRIPDSASSIVSYALFIASTYFAVFVPAFVLFAIPIQGINLLWPFLTIGITIAAWCATRRMKYINMGPLNTALNYLADYMKCQLVTIASAGKR